MKDTAGQPMRIVYFGSGAFGLPSLERLIESHDVALVVSQPDRPKGRRRQLTPTPITECAVAHEIPVLRPEDPNSQASIEAIHAVDADAYVVIAYGHKLSPDLLAETFAINLHASLLPKYRGAAPINWAMIHCETETGVSVITLAQRMDAGGILATAATPIDPMETAGELHDRLAQFGPDVILQVLAAEQAGETNAAVQNHSRATPAPKLSKADGTVSFDQPAERVRARIHGLTPWPGCTVLLDGSPLKLVRVEAMSDMMADGAPGVINRDGLVACASGMLRVLEVQPPGKRVMAFADFVNGGGARPGQRFEAIDP